MHTPEHRRYQNRRQSAREMGPHKKDSLRRPSLGDGKPARKRPRRIRPRSRFARSEQKADDQQRRVIESPGRENRKTRPPDNDPRQDAAGPQPIAPCPRRYFKNRI